MKTVTTEGLFSLLTKLKGDDRVLWYRVVSCRMLWKAKIKKYLDSNSTKPILGR